MLTSGASLSRTSGQQAERADRLKVVDPVQPVASPAANHSPLDGSTHDALARFARFIHKEKEKGEKPPRKHVPKGIPDAYRSQIEIHNRRQDYGSMLDVYI